MVHEGGGGGGELVVWHGNREEVPLIREERKNGLVTGGRVVVPRPPFSGHDEGGGEGARLLSLVQKYGKTQSEDGRRLHECLELGFLMLLGSFRPTVIK